MTNFINIFKSVAKVMAVAVFAFGVYSATPYVTLLTGNTVADVWSPVTMANANNFSAGLGNGCDNNNILGDGDNFWDNSNDYTPFATTPAPTCTISATPSSITAGESTTLHWNTTNTTSSSLNHGINIGGASSYTVSPTSTTTYVLTATGAGGTTTCAVTVTVTPVPHTPSCSLSVSPSTITEGSNATLTWTTSYANSASINNGIGNVALSGSYGVAGVNSTRTYTMTVLGDGGSATCSATLNVNPIVHTTPSCDVWTSPTSIESGGYTTLHWSSNDATSLYITGIGYVTPNQIGVHTFNNITTNRSYTCTARDDYGNTDTDTAHVYVHQVVIPAPTCNLTASPSSVAYGGNTVLSWTTTGAYSAVLSDAGNVPVNGSRMVYNLHTTRTYTLTVTGQGGTTTCTRQVGVYTPYVPPVQPPVQPVRPSCQIYVAPNSVAQNGTAILSWTAQNATGATLTDFGSVNHISGTKLVRTNTSRTYTLTVFNDGHRATCSTRLNVVAPVITYTNPIHHVALAQVPYTGAEDYLYPMFLLAIVLTSGYVLFTQRRRILA